MTKERPSIFELYIVKKLGLEASNGNAKRIKKILDSLVPKPLGGMQKIGWRNFNWYHAMWRLSTMIERNNFLDKISAYWFWRITIDATVSGGILEFGFHLSVSIIDSHCTNTAFELCIVLDRRRVRYKNTSKRTQKGMNSSSTKVIVLRNKIEPLQWDELYEVFDFFLRWKLIIVLSWVNRSVRDWLNFHN